MVSEYYIINLNLQFRFLNYKLLNFLYAFYLKKAKYLHLRCVLFIVENCTFLQAHQASLKKYQNTKIIQKKIVN